MVKVILFRSKAHEGCFPAIKRRVRRVLVRFFIFICCLFSFNSLLFADDKENDAEQYDSKCECRRNFYGFFWNSEKKQEEDETRHMGLELGIGNRGVLSESGSFGEKLSFEAGAWGTFKPFYFDVAMGIGSLFKDKGKIAIDARTRIWFSPLVTDINKFTGIYFGGGYVFKNKNIPYGILGIGRNLYLELNFREGNVAPVATIFAFGLRGRW